MTESAQAGPGDARVEPVFSTAGGAAPAVTPVANDGGEVGVVGRVAQFVRGWVAVGLGVMHRINLLAMALVILGMGLAVFAMGLVLYFWPQSPTLPAPVPVVAAGPQAPASATQGPLLPESHAQEQVQVQEPVASVPPLAEVPAMPAAASELSAALPVASEPYPGLAVEEPLAAPSPALAQAQVDVGFGADGNENSVPDILDRWLTGTLQSSDIQEAGRKYYRTVLPLATKLHLGITLSQAEKLSVLRAAECYLVTATEEGLVAPPNLNNQVLMQGGEAAERMKGLYKVLQGIEFPVSANRAKACG